MNRINKKLYEWVQDEKLDKALALISRDVRPYRNKNEMRYGVRLDTVSIIIASALAFIVLSILLAFLSGVLFGVGLFDFEMFNICWLFFVVVMTIRHFVLVRVCAVEYELSRKNNQVLILA